MKPLTNIKLLLLNVNRDGWHSGNMIYDMEVLKKTCSTVIYGPGWDNYEHCDIISIIDQVYGSDLPDIIYTYFTPNEKIGDVYIKHYNISSKLHFFPTGMHKLKSGRYKNIKRIFAVSDFWSRSVDQWQKDLKDSDFQFCVSCFTPPLSNPEDFFRFLNPSFFGKIKFLPLARCVDANCYKEYFNEKDKDIITVGSMCNFYPFRKWMHSSLKEYSKKTSLVYRNYPHCGTNWNHSGFIREEYAKAINKSCSLASCGGKYHLYFNKIFESWGCKTAYIGETPYGSDCLHMKDEYNFVAVNKTNFIDKVDYYVNNKNKLIEIAQNGQSTFLKHHTINSRAKDFLNLLEDFIF